MTDQALDQGNTPSNSKNWLKNHKDWLRLGAKILAVVFILWILFFVCFGLHRVSGPSMAERLKDGDLALYSRLTNDYQIGDVVIYEHDNKTYISTIIAEAEDVIEINPYGQLIINNSQFSDNIIFDPEQNDSSSQPSTFRVPSDSYYVLNENLDSLEDSRIFGAISIKDIKGKIIGLLRTRSV